MTVKRRGGGTTSRPLGIPALLRAGLAVGLLLFALVPVATAHEGLPRLILEPNRVNPGGVVTIRGEDLGADDQMRVALVGRTARADLTTVTSDGQGHFTISLQIAADAPAGVYAIEATGSSGYHLIAPLSIEGAPAVQADGAPVGQDEGLPALAPSAGAAAPGAPAAAAPSAAPRAASDPVATVTSVSAPLVSTTPDVDVVPFVALAGAIAALGFLVWRTRRSSTAPDGPPR